MLRKSLNFLRKPLVSPKELISLMATGDKNLRIINSTLTRPLVDVDYDHYFKQKRIPGSNFLNISVFCDVEDVIPHQLPKAHQFNQLMVDYDIKKDDVVVLYDDLHIAGAARTWWMLRTFGFEAFVLNGGFNGYEAAEGKIEEGEITWQPRDTTGEAFEYTPKSENVLDFNDVSCLAFKIRGGDSNFELVDARAGARFNAEVAEPRPDMRAGNIPGSKNVPFNTLLNEDGAYLSNEGIIGKFEDAGVDLSKEIVGTCGSGVTASVLQLSLEVINQGESKQRRIYDGSWADYGLREELTDEQIQPLLADFTSNKHI